MRFNNWLVVLDLLLTFCKVSTLCRLPQNCQTSCDEARMFQCYTRDLAEEMPPHISCDHLKALCQREAHVMRKCSVPGNRIG